MNAVQRRAMACVSEDTHPLTTTTTTTSTAHASPLLPTHWPRYRPVRVIGCGSFGTVYLCKDIESDDVVAVKAIPLADLSDEEVCLAMNEVSILRQLQHPHIVRYLDTFMDEPLQQLCLVTEYVDGGDVGALIKEYSKQQQQQQKSESNIDEEDGVGGCGETNGNDGTLQACGNAGNAVSLTTQSRSEALQQPTVLHDEVHSEGEEEEAALRFTQGSATSEGATWYSSASFQPCQTAASYATHMRLSSNTLPDNKTPARSLTRDAQANTNDIQQDTADDDEDVLHAKEGTWLASFLITDIVRQCLEALRYLHGLSIVHRDIKPSNIYLTRDGVVKLGDFGVSKLLSPSEPFAHTFIGTPFYLSPELCLGEAYSFAADIWALGVLTYEMYCLRLPFAARNVLAQIHIITEGSYDHRSLNLAHRFAPATLHELRTLHGADFERNESLLHSLVIDLVEQMLTMDPLRRPSAAQLLEQCYGVTNADRPSAPPTAYGQGLSSARLPSAKEEREDGEDATQADSPHVMQHNKHTSRKYCDEAEDENKRLSSSHARLASRVERSFDDLCTFLPASRKASVVAAEMQARLGTQARAASRATSSPNNNDNNANASAWVFRSRRGRRSADIAAAAQETTDKGDDTGAHDVNVLTLDTVTEVRPHTLSSPAAMAAVDELDIAIHSYTRHAITEMIEQVPWLRNAEAFSALALHAGSDDVVLVEHDGMDLVSFYSALSPTHRAASPADARKAANEDEVSKQTGVHDTIESNKPEHSNEDEVAAAAEQRNSESRRAFARAIASLVESPHGHAVRARRRVSLARRPQSQRTRPPSAHVHAAPLASTITVATLRGWAGEDRNTSVVAAAQQQEGEEEGVGEAELRQPRLSRHGSDPLSHILGKRASMTVSSATTLHAVPDACRPSSSTSQQLTRARMSNASLPLQAGKEQQLPDAARRTGAEDDVKQQKTRDNDGDDDGAWGTATLERLIRAKIMAHHTQRYARLHAQRQANTRRAALHAALRQQLQSLYTNTYQATLRPSDITTNNSSKAHTTAEQEKAEKDAERQDGESVSEQATMHSAHTLADTQPPPSLAQQLSNKNTSSSNNNTMRDAAIHDTPGQPALLLEAAVQSVLRERSARQYMTRSLHNSSARALSSAPMTLRSASHPAEEEEEEDESYSDGVMYKASTARGMSPAMSEKQKEDEDEEAQTQVFTQAEHTMCSKANGATPHASQVQQQQTAMTMCGHEVPSVETLAAHELAQAAREAAAQMRYRHFFASQPPARLTLSPALRPVCFDAVESELWESSSMEEGNEARRGCRRDRPRVLRREQRCRWSATQSSASSSCASTSNDDDDEEKEDGEEDDEEERACEEEEEEKETSSSSSSIATLITGSEEEEEEAAEDEEEDEEDSATSATSEEESRAATFMTTTSTTATSSTSSAFTTTSSEIEEEEEEEEEGVYTALYDAADGSRYFDYNLPLTLVLVDALPYTMPEACKAAEAAVPDKEEEEVSGVRGRDTRPSVLHEQAKKVGVFATQDEAATQPTTRRVRQPVALSPTAAIYTNMGDEKEQPLCIVGQGLQAAASPRLVVPSQPAEVLVQQQSTTKNDTLPQNAHTPLPDSNDEGDDSDDEDKVVSLTPPLTTTPGLPITLALRPLRDRTRLSGLAWRVRQALQHASLDPSVVARLYGKHCTGTTPLVLRLAQMQLYFCEPRQIVPPTRNKAAAGKGVQDGRTSIEGAVIALRSEEDWKAVRRVWAARYARRAFMRLYLVVPPE